MTAKHIVTQTDESTDTKIRRTKKNTAQKSKVSSLFISEEGNFKEISKEHNQPLTTRKCLAQTQKNPQ